MGPELIGKTLNRYQINSQLQDVGEDLLFLGVDSRSKREMIIRILPELFTHLPDFEERFLLSARVATRLEHPGIAKVVDYGKDKNLLYLVMEFIEGETLAQKLEDNKKKHEFLPQLEVIQIARQVIRALDYASKLGVEHIDIQPSKILLKPGVQEIQPVIRDLGLAWLVSGEKMQEISKLVVTPSFLSPEQAGGTPLDIRSDIYGVGVLLYELATFRLPFPVNTIEEVVEYHRKEQLPPPHLVRHNISDNLEQVILTALQKDPNKRFSDLAIFAKALENAATHPLAEPIKHSSPPPEPGKIISNQPQVDCLLVETSSRPAYTITIKQGEMSIGRGNEADIPLNSLAVSHTHAKLIFDGRDYYLIDLESTNGTYLDDGKLLAGVREIWTPSKVGRIGPFTLRLVRGNKLAALSQDEQRKSQILRRDGSLVEQKHVHISTGEGRIGVFLEEDDLEVAPGDSVVMTIFLRNQGETVDQFRVSIEGVPSSWVNIQPQNVNLMPDIQGSVQATFSPIKASTNKAGQYDLTIRVFSTGAPDQRVEVIASLIVLPFIEYDSELHPKKIDTNQKARVTVRNQGNHPETFLLTLKDNADKLVFTPPQANMEIQEGQRGAFEFSAHTKQLQLVRKSVMHAYTAELSIASGGEKRTYNGEIISTGLIPVWLPQVLLFLCLGLAAVTTFAVAKLIIPKQPTPTPSAVPVDTVASPPPFSVLPEITTPITPTLLLTPTPDISPTPTKILCGDFISQNFKNGEKVKVDADGGLHIYKDPQYYPDYFIDTLPNGTVLVIKDIPKCVTYKVNGYKTLMWNVKVSNKDEEGWVVESINTGYLIKPIN